MHHWKAKHSQKVVSGGALRGLTYGELTQEQLSRAARRYPGDPKLQKYAKTIIASLEVDGDQNEPEPCLPVAVRERTQSGKEKTGCFRCRAFFFWLYHLNIRRAVVFALCMILLVFLLKPSLATICTQVLVKFMRLVIRRSTGFIIMLLEGLLDEIVYQIEFSVRQVLPSHLDLDKMAQAPFNLMSHFVSALTGAGISMLTQYMQARRGQIPAANP